MRADAAALNVWVHEKVRQVGDEVAIRNRVGEANQGSILPGGDKCMGVREDTHERFGFVCGGALDGAVERDGLRKRRKSIVEVRNCHRGRSAAVDAGQLGPNQALTRSGVTA